MTWSSHDEVLAMAIKLLLSFDLVELPVMLGPTVDELLSYDTGA